MLASRRTTGSSTRCIGAGANSTMNTAMNSEQTNAITSAPPVIRIVDQISGQAWNVYTNVECGPASLDWKIRWIWLSTSPPPEPNHDRPLCENEGHASRNTNTSIASSRPTTTQTSVPRENSARWSSLQRGAPSMSVSSSIPARSSSLLVERRHRAGLADHRAGLAAGGDPVDELLDVRVRMNALARGRDHRPDPAPQRVALVLDVRGGAGDVVDRQRLDAAARAGVSEPDVADRTRVLGDLCRDLPVAALLEHARGLRLSTEHR